MHRRDLLKTAAAVAISTALPSLSAIGGPVLRRVRPSDAAWPDSATWQALKAAVGGNLTAVHPLLADCQSDTGSAACRDVEQNLSNPFYLGDQPGGTQVSGWLDAWTPSPSAYAVAAHSTADVVAAVNFAREKNLRLVVKGTGHSYQGTSNAPDSLLVWTRQMNKVTLHDTFVPQGSSNTPVPAVSTEPGAMWIDLYNAVTTQGGRYVQGGGCTDVGVAGLVQSGGFGSMSKGFGTAASNLLEAEVVTADGAVRIANADTNSDLFWAIKGGGGGSWGVVTRLTLRTHDLPDYFGGAWGAITANSDDAFRRLLARFFAFYRTDLLNPHWGEQIQIGQGKTFRISTACQGLTPDEAKAAWKPFFDWIAAAPKDYTVIEPLRAGAIHSRYYWSLDGNPSMNADKRSGAPGYHGWWKADQDQVGAFLHGYDSLWLPASLLDPAQLDRFVSALFAASRFKQVGLHLNKGLAGAPDSAISATLDTATNPAVTRAFALAIIADGEGPAYPGLPRAPMDMAAAHKDARDIDAATSELRRVVPDAGSYVSESNYFNADWQNAFWGKNYARLRAIKDKYDPGGLFFVHHGVGSENWSADGFTLIGKR